MLVGSSVKRTEDRRFLLGRGTFVNDVTLPDMAHAAYVRSPHAHAKILGFSTEKAKAMPGVLAVLTAQDWHEAGLGSAPCLWEVNFTDGTPMNEVPRPILARDTVRYVGDTVALAVAEDPHRARDAAEAIEVDYEPLPSVTDTAKALDDDAPVLHEQFGTNLCYDWEFGDKAELEAIFATAAHVTALDLINNRLAAAYMETRATIGHYDSATDHYTFWGTCQGPHSARRWLAEYSLRVPEHKIRVVAPDVGGGFGPKMYHYSEDPTVLWASKLIGRPVRWSASRGESLAIDAQARDHVTTCDMAFDEDGKILAVRADVVANLGAYLSLFGAGIPSLVSVMLPGLYTLPAIYTRIRGVYTNTAPTDAYRGAGRPEALFILERLLENGAREMGIDVCELRTRNFIQPEQFPYTTPTECVYDSGNLPGLMTRISAASRYDELRSEQARLRDDGVLMGIGLAAFMDCAGYGPSRIVAQQGSRQGWWDSTCIRVHPTGKITVLAGSHNHGQGHETTYAQIAADQLGCTLDDIEIVEGDTDRTSAGIGTGGSRCITVLGSAIKIGTDRIIEKGSRLAAHLLECAPEDIVFEEGAFVVQGTDRKMTFAQVAHAAYYGADYPDDFELGLEETTFFDPPDFNWPSALHLCTVLVDTETGRVSLRDYYAIDDVGRVINPMIVEGQVHGGLAQGIGQALMEHVRYDPQSGQLISGSFMDYSIPRADDLPPFECMTQETLSPTNPLGVKGAGESGIIGPPAALGNAVVDALWHLGVRHVEMPMTPMRVLESIREAAG